MRVPLRDQSCADRCASWLEPKRPVPCEATGAAVGFLDLLGQLFLWYGQARRIYGVQCWQRLPDAVSLHEAAAPGPDRAHAWLWRLTRLCCKQLTHAAEHQKDLLSLLRSRMFLICHTFNFQLLLSLVAWSAARNHARLGGPRLVTVRA